MKYKDITEYNIIDDSGFSKDPLPVPNDIILGTIQYKVFGKNVNIYKIENVEELVFLIGHDVNNIVGYLGLRKRGDNFYTAFKAHTSEPGNGLISTLIIWVLDNYNAKILSDTKLTKAGERLWKRLAMTHSNRIKIVNTETGDEYSINDKGAIDPVKDNRIEEFFDLNPDGQTWFYLLECRDLNFKGTVLPKFGVRHYKDIPFRVFGNDFD